jgi:hypothetical protein
MGTRLELHSDLLSILASGNVYFQPPATVQMSYPAIVYQRTNINIKRADDCAYKYANEYTVTVIDQNPDSLIPGKMLTLPMCKFDRHYAADNLNHDVFIVYY